MKQYKCENCGAPLNKDLKCEYCGTQYAEEWQQECTILRYEKPGVKVLRASVLMDRYMHESLSTEEIVKIVKRDIARRIVYDLDDCMEIESMYDPMDRTIKYMATMRVLEPEYRFR